MEDTICSIATGNSIGAISIIRVSGKDSIKIVAKIFKGKDLNKVVSHTLNYGFIMDKTEIIDEVLVAVMRGPKTYTREDIIEINSHGGIETTTKILELLLEFGCRLAEPGEFTKRAFLNGRIDLTQPEAVIDLINSKSNKARVLSLNNLGGSLKEKIGGIRKNLVDIMANIEVNIDYPEYEDNVLVTKENLLPKLLNSLKDIEDILNGSRNGKLIQNGINVAIVGKPNVGKSSILNRFLDEDRAIVTDIAGTTRDIVEGSVTLNGFLVNFIDTAGIRETDDVVERIGVLKSKEVLNKADIVIIVLNNNEELTDYERELIKSVSPIKRIIFVNKSDLENKLVFKDDFVLGNTLDDQGLDDLKAAIIEKLGLNSLDKDLTYMSNARQIDLIKKALKSIQNAIQSLEKDMPVDIVEIDITSAWNYLGEITGEVYQDELLDTLFKNFCVGK